MNYINVLTGYLLVFSLIIFLYIFLRTNDIFNKKMISGLKWLLFTILCLSILDIINFGLCEHVSDYNNTIIILWNIVLILEALFVPVPMILFILLYKKNLIIKKIFFSIPYLLLIIGLIINLFVPCMFEVTSNGIESKALYHLPLFVTSCYTFYFFLIALLNRSGKKSIRQFSVIIGIITTSFTGLVVECIAKTRFSVEFAYSISFVAYYMYLLSHFFRVDGLTKLLNRQAFYNNINGILKKDFSLVLLDMDGLKEVNDTQGHLEGNRCLVSIARTLEETFSTNCTVYRAGGDEFYVVCPGYDYDKTNKTMEQAAAELNKLGIIISYGIIENDFKRNSSEIINATDIQLYQMKTSHKLPE